MVGAGPVARFELTDHNGNRVSEASFAERFLLVFFGFTHCRVVCPRSLAKLSAALELLGEQAEAICPLYITVDPERDTPEVMRRFLEERHPRFMGLTGTFTQVDAAKKAFRIFAERRADPDDPDGYAVPHTAIAYLMGPDGGHRDHFTDALDEETLARRIRAAMEKEVRHNHH